jgi:hypothetical protein
MGNAQKPTPRTRHIDIKYFALCDWIKRDLLLLKRIDTSINPTDHLTKTLSRILFHRHADFLLGHVPPKYSPVYRHAITTYGNFIRISIRLYLNRSPLPPLLVLHGLLLHLSTKYGTIRGY